MAGDWIARLQIQEILAGGGSGTVTSVGLTMPTGFSVSGSPITTSGTLAVTTSLNGHISGNGSGFTASATIPTADLSGALLAANFPALTGDVTTPGASLATTIAADAVTNAKLANMATARFKGRVTAGTGDPEDLTGTQATTLLDVFTSALKGLVPASGGGTTNFLRADGSWAAAGGGGGLNSGLTTVDFGAFPGASDCKTTITGQAGIVAGSKVKAYIIATATADHSADEHWVETIEVRAGNIIAGTGFDIYAKNTNQINEPVRDSWASTRLAGPGTGINQIRPDLGPKGTRLYGQFTVAWEWY